MRIILDVSIDVGTIGAAAAAGVAAFTAARIAKESFAEEARTAFPTSTRPGSASTSIRST